MLQIVFVCGVTRTGAGLTVTTTSCGVPAQLGGLGTTVSVGVTRYVTVPITPEVFVRTSDKFPVPVLPTVVPETAPVTLITCQPKFTEAVGSPPKVAVKVKVGAFPLHTEVVVLEVITGLSTRFTTTAAGDPAQPEELVSVTETVTGVMVVKSSVTDERPTPLEGP